MVAAAPGHEDRAMDAAGEWANEVRLVGRVSAQAVERELPSGDTVASLRVVVPRPQRARAAPGRGAGVDTIDVSCWTARTRRTARGLAPGDVVTVEGALRRRFFRAGTAAASRYEVEASTMRRTS
jgi:single-strand DNA-binding protein